MTWGAGKTGVVLLAMGGPATVGESRDYLRRLFEDPMLVQLPGGRLFRSPLAGFISKRRARIAGERYEAIGGGSPLLAETQRLANLLFERLHAPVAIAMRYSHPFSSDAVAALSAAGVQRVVAIPLYPQFSTSTTASSLADFAGAAAGNLEALVGVSDHHVHPGYVAALAAQTAKAVGALGNLRSSHILFTAHSIPESLTKKGDPYIAQVRATVDAVAASLKVSGIDLPFSLAFQSRVRFGKWHGPAAEDAVSELAATGIRRLVVAPVSFVSENLETLFDLDIELKDLCSDEGFVEFSRAATLSDSTLYADALADLARAAAAKSLGEA